MLVIAPNEELGGFGLRCPVSSVNVQWLTRIFGVHTLLCSWISVTRRLGKETGKTSSIERFNGTMRQRVSRLVRKTLSFSKRLENHIGAIWLFIHYYNSSLPL
jgi:hypothetical protein